MRVAVIGAGAMGCLYGALLARVSGSEVILIDHGPERVAAINRSGVLIKASERNFAVRLKARVSPEGLAPRDLVLVLVKSGSTAEAARTAAALAGPSTVVLSLQNGLGNFEILSSILGPEMVLGGTTTFGASVEGHGVVSWRGAGRTVMAEADGGLTERLMRIGELMEAAGLAPSLSTDLRGLIWTKLLASAGVNAIAALLGVTNGRILELPEAAALSAAAVTETAEVAAALGVRLSVADPVAHVWEVCRLTAGNVCSTLQDVRARRPTEIAAINGAVAEAGRRAGVEIPVNEVLAWLMAALERTF
jgi:2-dehydropantoate 2-reductase